MQCMKALSIHITGVVQGVGFRPFVYNLAQEYNLKGWVLNASDGVHVHVEGPESIVDSFPIILEKSAPEAAVIEHVSVSNTKPESFAEFEIRASAPTAGERTLISPDMATCKACETELFDPKDRRYRYPFINCTDCGPRFTIIKDTPYDRPLTTMDKFKMCPECQAEYEDPSNRRFHAQPDACFVCGPRLYLNLNSEMRKNLISHNSDDCTTTSNWEWIPGGVPMHRNREEEQARSNSIIIEAAEALTTEKIVAIKGLGGFQLACNARSSVAVRKLRERKHRYGKPLAVMFANFEQAERYVHINEQERELLEGRVRPIVLLKRRKDVEGVDLAEEVAFGMPEIGVMLPYTGMHHLLLDEFYGPLVMTSGNISEEPIITDNAEALKKLDSIADMFLLHDRDIHARYDDSVVRVVDSHTQMVRRARGYAPYPLMAPAPHNFSEKIPPTILAVGPEQKNTFTLLDGEYAFVSQHIGDLENTETLDAFEESETLYERLFRVHPEALAYDLHPEYLSTKWAKVQEDVATRPVKLEGVQHHHAHIVACTAEHNYAEPVIGFAFDGTGYGDKSDPKANIWGSEVLIADWTRYTRFAHLLPLPLPGSAGAIKRPARIAVGMLAELGLLEHPGAAGLLSRLEDREANTVVAMMRHGLNTPYTTSMGRLFDAVSSLIGVTDNSIFEGSAAVLLEGASDDLAARPTPTRYQFIIHEQTQIATLSTHELNLKQFERGFKSALIDPRPLIVAILDDLATGIDQAEIARRFHSAVITLIGDVATKASRATNIKTVALSGGVFMNRMIFGGARALLETKGFTVLTPEKLPVNDGCISFGQSIVARERLIEKI